MEVYTKYTKEKRKSIRTKISVIFLSPPLLRRGVQTPPFGWGFGPGTESSPNYIGAWLKLIVSF